MTEDEIREIVKDVLNTPAGFKFAEILLDKLGAFERGTNVQNVYTEYFVKGKREQGLWLLDLIKDSNFNQFVEIMKKRRYKCQKKQQQEQD